MLSMKPDPTGLHHVLIPQATTTTQCLGIHVYEIGTQVLFYHSSL